MRGKWKDLLLVSLSPSVTLHFLSCCFFFFYYSLFLNICEAILFGSFLGASFVLVPRGTIKKNRQNVSLCWVSLGRGNEGLSNWDSYFTVSIIYGETGFGKGH